MIPDPRAILDRLRRIVAAEFNPDGYEVRIDGTAPADGRLVSIVVEVRDPLDDPTSARGAYAEPYRRHCRELGFRRRDLGRFVQVDGGRQFRLIGLDRDRRRFVMERDDGIHVRWTAGQLSTALAAAAAADKERNDG